MRIAIFSGTFLKDKDGVARSIYELVDYLLRNNHNVMVFSPLITPQNRKGLTLVKIPSFPIFFYPDYHFSVPSADIFRKLRQFEPDIIQIGVPDFIAWIVLTYARIMRIPVVSINHTNFASYMKFYKLGFMEKLIWQLIVGFYKESDRVFSPTKKFSQILYKKRVKNVDVWSRGVDDKIFNPTFRSKELRESWGGDHKKYILFAGRFVWYKGFDVIIEVYNSLKDRLDSEIGFIFLGYGPIKEDLQKIMPKAIFPGFLHGRKLGEVYASSDLMLFPSTTETFGQVVQEALASGLPTVVSNAGGCQEIIRNSNGGFIISAGNIKKFLYHVEILIDNPQIYHQKRINGLKYAKQQSWDNINGDLVRKYHVMTLKSRKNRDLHIQRIFSEFPLIRWIYSRT